MNLLTRKERWTRLMIEEEELPPLLEVNSNTIEEDRYIRMKDAYKEGKKDCEACLGAPITAAELAEEKYGDDEDRIERYLWGWNYQLTLMTK